MTSPAISARKLSPEWRRAPWMGLFAFLSCCGWGVAHSRAPFGESPTGTGGSRVLPPKEAAARDAQQSDRDGRAPLLKCG